VHGDANEQRENWGNGGKPKGWFHSLRGLAVLSSGKISV